MKKSTIYRFQITCYILLVLVALQIVVCSVLKKIEVMISDSIKHQWLNLFMVEWVSKVNIELGNQEFNSSKNKFGIWLFPINNESKST